MRLQTEKETESLEALLEKANHAALENKTATPSPLTQGEMDDMLQSPGKLRNLAKSALIEIIRLAPRTPGLVPAIKELLDRIDGKAKERIDINTTGSVVLFNVQLDYCYKSIAIIFHNLCYTMVHCSNGYESMC